MVQGRRRAQRLLIMQQASLVWAPIEHEWQAVEFIQRGAMPKPVSQHCDITPQVQAKIEEYRTTGRLTFDEVKTDGSKG